MNSHHEPMSPLILKACTGVSASVLGLLTSAQEQIEWILRVVSLSVGIAVGIVTLISILRKRK